MSPGLGTQIRLLVRRSMTVVLSYGFPLRSFQSPRPSPKAFAMGKMSLLILQGPSLVLHDLSSLLPTQTSASQPLFLVFLFSILASQVPSLFVQAPTQTHPAPDLGMFVVEFEEPKDRSMTKKATTYAVSAV